MLFARRLDFLLPAVMKLSIPFIMKRKIGSLGLSPVKAGGFSHSGCPGNKGGPEYYLDDKINLNIVYSVYENPKTM